MFEFHNHAGKRVIAMLLVFAMMFAILGEYAPSWFTAFAKEVSEDSGSDSDSSSSENHSSDDHESSHSDSGSSGSHESSSSDSSSSGSHESSSSDSSSSDSQESTSSDNVVVSDGNAGEHSGEGSAVTQQRWTCLPPMP